MALILLISFSRSLSTPAWLETRLGARSMDRPISNVRKKTSFRTMFVSSAVSLTLCCGSWCFLVMRRKVLHMKHTRGVTEKAGRQSVARPLRLCGVNPRNSAFDPGGNRSDGRDGLLQDVAL